ncbi:MAG TPA: glycogen-binding domain-containing protein [Gemmatimonadaceae bacterium]
MTRPDDSAQRHRVPIIASVRAGGRIAFALTCLAAAVTRTAAAQRIDATLDAGAAAIRYSDSVDAGAAVLSPSVRLSMQALTVGATASFAELNSGTWAAQGSLGGSAYSPPLGPLRAEFDIDAAGSDRQDGEQTGQLEGFARLDLTRAAWGAWIGGGTGRAWDGSAGHSLTLGDAGVWLARHALTASLSATPTAIDDSISYTDFEAAARWARARLELRGSLGARAGHALAAASSGRTWGSIGAVYWVGPRVGISADAGLYPPDIAQGFPNGRYVSLGVRLSMHPMWRSRIPTSSGTDLTEQTHTGSARTGVIEEFTVQSAGTQRTIRVHAPRAHLVEFASDVTNWSPVALSRDDAGWWTGTFTVAPGIHQMSLRLDGQTWIVPPGFVSVTDEFGVTAGVWDVK